MPKFKDQAIEVIDDPRDEFIGNAKIRVGAQRAPRITPVDPAIAGRDSSLGRVFEMFGDFADGAFSKAVQGAYDDSLKAGAERAVLEGVPLEFADDGDNLLFEAYYNGAKGRRVGADVMGEVRQLFETNADDVTFDFEGAATSLVTERLGELNDDQAANAVAVIKAQLPDTMDREKVRRTNQARNEIIASGREARTNENLGWAAAGDYLAVRHTMDIAREEERKVDGAFDADAHNLWQVNEWISYLNEFGPDPAWKEALQLKTDGKSLWTNPKYGPRLRKAWNTAVNGKATIDAERLGLARARAEDELKKTESLSPATIADLQAAGEKDGAMITWHKRKFLAENERAEQTADFAQLTNQGPTAPDNATQVSAAHDMDNERFYATMERGRKELLEAGVEPERVDQFIASQEARFGRVAPDSVRRLKSGLLSKDPQQFQDAYMHARTYYAQNQELFDTLPDSVRHTVEIMNIFTRQGLTSQDYIAGRASFNEGAKVARAAFKEKEGRAALASAREDLPTTMHYRVEELAIGLLAMNPQLNAEAAADLAAEELQNGLTKVGTLGSRLQIEAGTVDARFGNAAFYQQYEQAGIDLLSDERGLQQPGVILLDPTVGLGGADAPLTQDLDFWPRVDGSSWVYHDQRLIAIIPTQDVLDRVDPRLAAQEERKLDKAATRSRKLQERRQDNIEFGELQ